MALISSEIPAGPGQQLQRRQRNEEWDPNGSCWAKSDPNIPDPWDFHPHRHNKGFQRERESLGTLGLEKLRGIRDLGASRHCRAFPSLRPASPASFHLLLPTFPPFPVRFPSHSDSSPAFPTPNKSQENPSVFHLRHAPPAKQIRVGLSRRNQLHGLGTDWNKSSNVFIWLFPSSSELFWLIRARDEGAHSRLGSNSRRQFRACSTSPAQIHRERGVPRKRWMFEGKTATVFLGWSPGPATNPWNGLGIIIWMLRGSLILEIRGFPGYSEMQIHGGSKDRIPPIPRAKSSG